MCATRIKMETIPKKINNRTWVFHKNKKPPRLEKTLLLYA